MWMWTWEHVDNGHVDMWTCGYRQWTCGCENMWTWGHVYTWMWTMDRLQHVNLMKLTQHYNRGGIIIKTIT